MWVWSSSDRSTVRSFSTTFKTKLPSQPWENNIKTRSRYKTRHFSIVYYTKRGIKATQFKTMSEDALLLYLRVLFSLCDKHIFIVNITPIQGFPNQVSYSESTAIAFTQLKYLMKRGTLDFVIISTSFASRATNRKTEKLLKSKIKTATFWFGFEFLLACFAVNRSWQ